MLYGRSIGSGPSCYLAAKTALRGQPVAALILHSAFTSVFRLVVDLSFTLPTDKFTNIDRISKIGCPALVLHGTEDSIVPIKHGRKLFQALPNHHAAESLWIEGMGHNDIDQESESAIIESLRRFLSCHVLSQHSSLNPSEEDSESEICSESDAVNYPTNNLCLFAASTALQP